MKVPCENGSSAEEREQEEQEDLGRESVYPG